MNLARYMFARLYGYALGRSYRNDPEQACQDAITPFMILIGIPALCSIVVVIAVLFPQALASKDWVPWVTVPGGVIMFIISRSLKRYAQTPEMADNYRSSASRKLTMAMYIAVLVGSILLAGFGARIIRAH